MECILADQLIADQTLTSHQINFANAITISPKHRAARQNRNHVGFFVQVIFYIASYNYFK